MTRRRKIAIAIPVLVVLAGGIAHAAGVFSLRGRGTATALNLVWESTAGSNDGAGQNDPSNPFYGNPSREQYDVGSTGVVVTAGQLVATTTNGYPGYQYSYRAVAAQSNMRVQSVSIVDDPTVAGSARWVAGDITATLDSSSCGLSLAGATAASRTVDGNVSFVNVPEGPSPLAFKLTLHLIPVGATYVPGNCQAFN